MADPNVPETSPLGPEAIAAQKRRNMWLALALVGFVLIVGVTTTVRIQESVKDDCNRFYMAGGVRDVQEEERCRRQKARFEATQQSEAPSSNE